jgi:hypothetical protein
MTTGRINQVAVVAATSSVCPDERPSQAPHRAQRAHWQKPMSLPLPPVRAQALGPRRTVQWWTPSSQRPRRELLTSQPSLWGSRDQPRAGAVNRKVIPSKKDFQHLTSPTQPSTRTAKLAKEIQALIRSNGLGAFGDANPFPKETSLKDSLSEQVTDQTGKEATTKAPVSLSAKSSDTSKQPSEPVSQRKPQHPLAFLRQS